MSKGYTGYVNDRGCVVTVTENGKTRPLRMRLDLINHSPTGLNWGYEGSGPAQTALAILADALGDDERAVRLHQKFKRQVVAHWPMNASWSLSSYGVQAFAVEQETPA